MKTAMAAALILLAIPAASLAQRTPAQAGDRNVPAPARTPADADTGSSAPRVAPPTDDRSRSEDAPPPTRSLYGNGIRTPWQDNPIRVPWQ